MRSEKEKVTNDIFKRLKDFEWINRMYFYTVCFLFSDVFEVNAEVHMIYKL